MIIICGPSLGKTRNCSGKHDADNDADDVAEKRYQETNPLGVVFYNPCDVVTHLCTTPSPNYGKEYPRPHQHNEDASQEVHIIGSCVKS